MLNLKYIYIFITNISQLWSCLKLHDNVKFMVHLHLHKHHDILLSSQYILDTQEINFTWSAILAYNSTEPNEPKLEGQILIFVKD